MKRVVVFLVFLLSLISTLASPAQVNFLTGEIREVCGADNNCEALVKTLIEVRSGGGKHFVNAENCVGPLAVCADSVNTPVAQELLPVVQNCCPHSFLDSECTSENNHCRTLSYVDSRFGGKENILWGSQLLLNTLRQENGNLYLLGLHEVLSPTEVEAISQSLDLSRVSPLSIEKAITSSLPGSKAYLAKRGRDVRKYLASLATIYTSSFGGEMDNRGYLPSLSTQLRGTMTFEQPPIPSEEKKEEQSLVEVPKDFVGLAGTYSRYPGFHILLPFQSSEFAQIQTQVRQLASECIGNDDLENCLSVILTNHNAQIFQLEHLDQPKPVWTRGPCASDTDELKLAYDLATCAHSSEDNCVCSLRGANAKLGHEHNADLLHLYTSTGRRIERYPATLALQSDTLPITLSSVEMSQSDQGITISGATTSVGAVPLELFTTADLKVLKQGNQLIFNSGNFAQSPCTAKPRIETFCVESPQRLYPSLVMGSGSKPLKYRFAVDFGTVQSNSPSLVS